MHVIATAGHVDHGKSTLVRALTGMEPDRWREEHRRGLTIDLGYVWTELPSGKSLAFVDVPGHQRFVSNMLAGVGPAPAVMFVVAADEGWMPQSTEHLDAISALGVDHGLLAVTRSDLADPQPALHQALGKLAGSSLGHVDSLTVSGASGDGIPALHDALDRLVGGLPAPDAEASVRLWIDRAFTIHGAGTVVTGTLPAGTLRVGDELELAPGRRRVRVRGLQSRGRSSDSVAAVARVAVNLRGVDLDDVHRGMALLTPDSWLATRRVDVRLRAPLATGGDDARRTGDPAAASDLPAQLTLHFGAAAVSARVRPLGDDTARLTLPRPLPARVGDVALLRDPGRRAVLAGVTVLDVRPPELRRRGAGTARAQKLEGMAGVADGAAELARRGMMRRRDLEGMGCDVPDAAVRAAGEWLADRDHWAGLRRRLVEAVRSYASAHPLDPRMPAEVARRAVDLPDLRVLEALATSAKDGGSSDGGGTDLAYRDGAVSQAGAEPLLPESARDALTRLRGDLEAAPFTAPDASRLGDLGLTAKLLSAAARAGELAKIADGVYLLPGSIERAAGELAALEQPFTVSQARQALGTTRRVAVPLLEYLDARGYTRRVDTNHRTTLSG